MHKFKKSIRCWCEELWKNGADTGTTSIVTNLPGAALFIQLCCTDCGARPQATES